MQLARSLRPQAGLRGAARWQQPAPRGLSGAALVQRRARLGLLLKEVRAPGDTIACTTDLHMRRRARQGPGRQEP